MIKQDKAKMALTMFIFGTIGIFVTHINIPSSYIVFFRAIIGSVFLSFFAFLKKERLSFKSISKNSIPLILSGTFLGLNWIFLFEAYKHTTIATATLCYYFAPFFLVLLMPFVTKERITLTKLFCILIALCGMFLISEINVNSFEIGQVKGILFGISAAFLYSLIIIVNKKLDNINVYEKTISQFLVASIVLLPYLVFFYDITTISFSLKNILLILIVGIIHTGIAYLLYFKALENLTLHITAIFSYIDPVTAVIISSILEKSISLNTVIGALLILGSAIYLDMKN